MSREIIGLIPAAGKGLRLGLPYPKELYPIICNNRYKPVSQFVLDNLVVAGVEHVVFVINETKHQVIGFFGDGHRFGCRISYVVQEPDEGRDPSTSPGLAHALASAHHLTKGKTVFFGMADTIMHPTSVFSRAYAGITANDDVVLGLFVTERPEKFGMVRLDEQNRVVEVVDKPRRTDLKQMWGFAIWGPRFAEHLHDCVAERGMTDFALILNEAIVGGLNLRGVPIAGGTYLDLGTYDELAALDRRFRED